MSNYIILISAIGTFFLAITMHEFGHYIPSFIFGYKPKMYIDNQWIPSHVISYSFNFNKYYLKIMTLLGIFVGFIPIYMYYKLFSGQFAAILIGIILAAYFVACHLDFIDLIKGHQIIKQKNLSEFTNI